MRRMRTVFFAEKVAALVNEQGYTQVRAEETVQKEYGRSGYSERQTGLTVWFAADSEGFSGSSLAEQLRRGLWGLSALSG